MAMHENSPGLRPLGLLAPEPGGAPWPSGSLETAIETPPDSVRKEVVHYLDACPIFLAWMEYTRDVIGDRFGVGGGSAIVSDGVYYWRFDATAYIEEYGISVPDRAIEHMRSRRWRPPEFSREQYLEIYRQLVALLGPIDPTGPSNIN
ncbi:hypothetical protein [Kribbella lupini]|uniref:Uncharacterized protein n=1 Tax=Kribbella lupini TaxID=291602 RepID=A0ABP4NBR3_9ACTN